VKKIISASFLAAFALTMLLPVTRQVNAASVNHSVLRQGTTPMPGSGGGGHYQGTTPMPGSGGGGHYQGTTPMPGSGGGGH
jgi:hypothetical protein